MLVPDADDTPIVYDFKAAALSDLKQRYTDDDITRLLSVLSVATGLDPRFRNFNFIRDANERDAKLQAVWEAVMQKVTEMPAEGLNEPDTSAGQSSSEEPAAEPVAKRAVGRPTLSRSLLKMTPAGSQIVRPLNSR